MRDSQVTRVKQVLVSAFKNNLAQNLAIELLQEEAVEENSCLLSNEDKQHGDWPTTWWQQFSVLIRRSIKERSHESFSILKITEVLSVALLSGILWWKSDPNHLQDQASIPPLPLF